MARSASAAFMSAGAKGFEVGRLLRSHFPNFRETKTTPNFAAPPPLLFLHSLPALPK